MQEWKLIKSVPVGRANYVQKVVLLQRLHTLETFTKIFMPLIECIITDKTIELLALETL